MKFLIFQLCLFILVWQQLVCQTKPKITDVDFRLEDNQIVVNYHLSGSLPKGLLTIKLKFIDETNKEILPISVTGDVGPKVNGDGNKTIYWNITTDKLELSGVLKAIVTITEIKISYKGPSYALFSVAMPGLGGYFVEKNKSRAIITTVGAVGLFAFGITEKITANKYYHDYNSSQNVTEIQALYNKANNAQHKYFLATRIGAVLWISDIAWVIIKGNKNKREAITYKNQNILGNMKLNYNNQGFQLGYFATF